MGDLEDAEGGNSGCQPREAHERKPDEQRVETSDSRCDEQRRHVPDLVVTQERKQVLHDRRLLGDRNREHAGGPGSDGDEADVPEREHAGVAHEDVEGDHDRHGHKRVDEVDLGRRRGDATEERGEDDESDRPSERRERAGAHTRSTGPGPRANNPFGRIRRTRITRPKTSDGRY